MENWRVAIICFAFHFLSTDGKWTLTNLAGKASSFGYVNGQASNARFQSNLFIGAFRNNLYYVADSDNHAIRTFDSVSGMVSTVAGSPQYSQIYGCSDGFGTNARFYFPQGLTATQDGKTMYIADTGNNCIRTVLLSGEVTTFAGTCGNLFTGDGCGSVPFVQLNRPTSIAIAGSREWGMTVFVSDRRNCRVLAIPIQRQSTKSDGAFSSIATFGNNACSETPTKLLVSPMGSYIFVSSQTTTECNLNKINILKENDKSVVFSATAGVCGPDGLNFAISRDDSNAIIWDRGRSLFEFLDLSSKAENHISMSEINGYPQEVGSMLMADNGSLIFTNPAALVKLSILNCPTIVGCLIGMFQDCSVSVSAGSCSNCSNGPENSTYISSGLPLNENNCSWECNLNFFADTVVEYGMMRPICRTCRVDKCPRGQYLSNCSATMNRFCNNCTDPVPENAIFTELCSFSNSVEKAFIKGAWVCNSGFYRKVPQFNCTICPTTACAVGQFRERCGNDTDGCINCSNLPKHGYFTEPGYPHNYDNCAWLCESAESNCYFRFGNSCFPCNTSSCGAGKFRGPCGNFSDAQCISCTNTIPANSRYTDKCTGNFSLKIAEAWICNDGFYSVGVACVPCEVTFCSIGFFRRGCGDSLDGISRNETHDGTCIPCSNGPSSKQYIGPGIPHNINNCSWQCEDGYFNVNESCYPCMNSTCPNGTYRTRCVNGSKTQSTCRNCTNAPLNSAYVGHGHFNNSCPFSCTIGFFRNSSICSKCNTSLCIPGMYRAPCNGFADAGCLACTNPKPQYSKYTNLCNASFDNVLATSLLYCQLLDTWTCEEGYYLVSSEAGCVCVSCPNSTCNSGFYRGECYHRGRGLWKDGACIACSNVIPDNSQYSGPGNPVNADNCSYSCNLGYFQSGLLCVVCNTSRCPVGLYRGTCNSTNDATCLPCAGAPANAYYIQASTSDLSHSPSLPDSDSTCSWACNSGYYFRSNSTSCLSCSQASCTAGNYRDASSCGGSKDSVCVPCTNNLNRSSFTFTGGGVPFDQNNCSYTCNSGYFRRQMDCRACSQTSCSNVGQYRNRSSCFGSDDSACVACTNGPADKSAFVYTSAGYPYYSDNCSFACLSNTFVSGTGATDCQLCSKSACPAGQYRGTCSKYSDAPCVTCNFSACSIGQYLESCSMFADSTCKSCTNAAQNAVYLSSGKPYDSNHCDWECDFGTELLGGSCVLCKLQLPMQSMFVAHLNNCSWECNLGYFKINNTCLGCNTSNCEIGYYRGLCGKEKDSECAKCTRKPDGAQYVSAGLSGDDCKWACGLGYFRIGTVVNGSCQPCNFSFCDMPGKYRGKCGDDYDAPCVNCTGFLPVNARYTNLCSGVESDINFYNQTTFKFNASNAPWKCNDGYFRHTFKSVFVPFDPVLSYEKNVSDLFASFDKYFSRFCHVCNLSRCETGQYRSLCAETSGLCIPCTKNPENSIFMSSGDPFDENNCEWACVPDYFAVGGKCLPCSKKATGSACPGCGKYWDGFCIEQLGNISGKIPWGTWVCGPGIYPSWNFVWSEYRSQWADNQSIGALNELVGYCDGNCSSRSECISGKNNGPLPITCKPNNPLTFYYTPQNFNFPDNSAASICQWRCIAGHFWNITSQTCVSCEEAICPSKAQYVSSCSGTNFSCERCGINRPKNSYVTKRGRVFYANDCFWELCKVKTCLPNQNYFECSELATEDDSYCSTRAIPENAKFISEGSENNGFAAAWICLPGYFAVNGSVCLPCTQGCPGCSSIHDGICSPELGSNSLELDPLDLQNINDFVCGPGTFGVWKATPQWFDWPKMLCKNNCTNAPDNSHYVEWQLGGKGSSGNFCPWKCNAGFYQNGTTQCLPCSQATCPIGQFIAQCGVNGLICSNCSITPPDQLRFSTSGSCGYRDDCFWNCSACDPLMNCAAVPLPSACPPGEFKDKNSCVPCSLLPCPPRFYREPCLKSNRTRDSFCLPCINDSCPVGFYRPQCINEEYHECISCSLKDDNELNSIAFLSAGVPYDTDNCNYTCNAGYEQTKPKTCEACLPGYYKSQAGIGTCVPCESGKYANQSGSTKCDL